MNPFLSLFPAMTLAALACVASAQGLPEPAAATRPPQFWASKNQLAPFGMSRAMTPDQVADQLAIKDAFERWGIAYDEGRLDVIRALFTRDAVYTVVNGQTAPPKELARAIGPDAIAGVVAQVLKQQADQRRHVVTNILADKTDASNATAIAYGSVTVAANGLKLGASVIYSAQLRREADGIWRFSRFVIAMDDYLGSQPVVPRP